MDYNRADAINISMGKKIIGRYGLNDSPMKMGPVFSQFVYDYMVQNHANRKERYFYPDDDNIKDPNGCLFIDDELEQKALRLQQYQYLRMSNFHYGMIKGNPRAFFDIESNYPYMFFTRKEMELYDLLNPLIFIDHMNKYDDNMYFSIPRGQYNRGIEWWLHFETFKFNTNRLGGRYKELPFPVWKKGIDIFTRVNIISLFTIFAIKYRKVAQANRKVDTNGLFARYIIKTGDKIIKKSVRSI